MTEPLTQVDIERMIVMNMEALEDATEVYGEALKGESLAEHAYKQKKARLFVNSTGSIRDREAQAELQCDAELRKYLKWVAQVKGTKEILNSIRARLDSLRSLNANVRDQV